MLGSLSFGMESYLTEVLIERSMGHAPHRCTLAPVLRCWLLGISSELTHERGTRPDGSSRVGCPKLRQPRVRRARDKPGFVSLYALSYTQARMAKTPQAVRTFDVEGQEVQCYQSAGHRLWRCECADFQRRLSQLGEGFCAHTAVAIMRLTEEGSIEL